MSIVARGAIHDLLIVEDNLNLRETLRDVLATETRRVRVASTLAEARAAVELELPNSILLDFELPDGNAHELLDALAGRHPKPRVIVMSGVAQPKDAFSLGRRGTMCFLEKPIDPGELQRALDEDEVTDWEQQVCAQVGRTPIHVVEQKVRSTMLNEALARSAGNRSMAARLLRVSRQLLQHMIRQERDHGSPPS